MPYVGKTLAMSHQLRKQDEHLLFVVKSENVSLIAPLITRAHANPSAPVDDFGNTITHIATQTGNVDVVDALFFYGAASDVKNNIGQSLWFSAVEPNSPDILGYLKDNSRTTFHDADNIGLTPLDWASMREKYDAAMVLRHWGADRLHENDTMTYHNGLILPKNIVAQHMANQVKNLISPDDNTPSLTVQDLLRDWRKGNGPSGPDYSPPTPS